MTTPSGQIGIQDIATELAQPSAGFNLDRLDVRALSLTASLTAGTPINMNLLRNKTCDTRALTIGVSGLGTSVLGYQSAASGAPYGSISNPNINGGRILQCIAFGNSGQFRLFLDTAPTALTFKLLLRTTTVGGGNLPDIVLDSATAATTIDPPNNVWVWDWLGGAIPLNYWLPYIGNTVSIQLVR